MTADATEDHSPLAAWRSNAFLVLGLSRHASRPETERAGQRLLALLAIGAAGANRYETPFGPGLRDADAVRSALGALRDPVERVAQELVHAFVIGEAGALCACVERDEAVAVIASCDPCLG